MFVLLEMKKHQCRQSVCLRAAQRTLLPMSALQAALYEDSSTPGEVL